MKKKTTNIIIVNDSLLNCRETMMISVIFIFHSPIVILLNCRETMIFVVFFISAQLFSIVQSDQQIVQAPQDTQLRLGETATLRCRVDDQKGALQWVKNGFGLGDDRSLTAYPRYSMIGQASEGEYNLQIENVQLEDDDVYECQLLAADGQQARISTAAKLTVLVEPDQPALRVMGQLKAIAGQSTKATCSSVNGKPPALLGWLISDRGSIIGAVRSLADTRNRFHSLPEAADGDTETKAIETIQKTPTGLYTVTSNLSFIPTADDDGKFLVCIASHETYKGKLFSSAVAIDVEYAPRVNLIMDNGGVRLREGGKALLACNVDAKPSENVQISWFRNGSLIRSATSDTLTFAQLRVEDDGIIYECRARNAIGIGADTTRLNISYGPRMLSTEQEMAVNPGQSVTFHCHVVGNPPPLIFWTKAAISDQILSRSAEYTIDSVQSWQRGEYVCTAMVDGFDPVSVSAFLHIRGPPIVIVSDKVTGRLGSTVEIVCEVRGRPQPHDVIWYRGDEMMDYGRLGGRVDVRQAPRQFGVESTLSIRQLRTSDLGLYKCSASNDLGRHSMIVRLAEQETLPLYLLIPIMVVLALLVLISCLYVMLRRRRCCGNSSSNGSRFTDEEDVTLKAECLDGQYLMPCNSGTNNGLGDMYGVSPLPSFLNHQQQYLPVQQDNPDLDWLPPPVHSPMVYPANSPLNYPAISPLVHPANYRFVNPANSPLVYPNSHWRTVEPASYGSFTSGQSTPLDMGNGGNCNLSDLHSIEQRPYLASVREEDLLLTETEGRCGSRSSTHV